VHEKECAQIIEKTEYKISLPNLHWQYQLN